MKKIKICITNDQYKIIKENFNSKIEEGIQKIIIDHLYEYTDYKYYEDKEITLTF